MNRVTTDMDDLLNRLITYMDHLLTFWGPILVHCVLPFGPLITSWWLRGRQENQRGQLRLQGWMTESTLWVIEVALGKRKLLERSEEEGNWGRSGPGAERLYGFFAIRGFFFRRSFDNF